MGDRQDSLNPHEFEDAKIRRRVRQAARSESAPAALEERIRARLDREDRGRRRLWYGAAVAATVLIAGWSASLCFTGFAPHEFIAQEIYIASLLRGLDPLLGAGLGDHIHCAFYRRFPDQRPTREFVVEELGEQWAPLEQVIQTHAPEGFEVRLAHRCERGGREFLHLALLRGDELLSLLLTEMRPDDALPSAAEFATARAERFAVTGFEVGGYTAFVVSELDEERNLAAARAWAEPLRQFLS